MEFYIDIKIVPDEEVPIYFIRNKVYTKLHKILHALKSTEIGISFPLYKVKLGGTVRLHGTNDRLSELQATNWLGGLSGYCEVGEVQTIPKQVTYRTISRKQSNMTEAKLRRLIKRGSISEDEAKKYKAKMYSLGMDNPYLELESSSNGHKHRRYLVFGDLLATSAKGEFDTFGLSKTATIPWF